MGDGPVLISATSLQYPVFAVQDPTKPHFIWGAHNALEFLIMHILFSNLVRMRKLIINRL